MTTKESFREKMQKYLITHPETNKETSSVLTFCMLPERDDDTQTSVESSPSPTNLWPDIGGTNITPQTTPETDYFTTEWKDLTEDKPRPVELVYERTKFSGEYIIQNHSGDFPALGAGN